MTEIISREEWHDMLERSRDLLARAEHANRVGDAITAASIWRELGPLNRKIRSRQLLVRGIDA